MFEFHMSLFFQSSSWKNVLLFLFLPRPDVIWCKHPVFLSLGHCFNGVRVPHQMKLVSNSGSLSVSTRAGPVCMHHPHKRDPQATGTNKMNANYSRGLLRKHMNNAALINPKIKEIKVSSTTECALSWLRSFLFVLINTGVHSYLANHGTTRPSLICQLNNASADSNMENFVNICGLKHYSTISRNWNTNLVVL